MWQQLAPFLLAVLFVAVSPKLDDLTWRNAYRSFYATYGSDRATLYTPENLTSGASWAVDLAHVVPGVLLAWVGILLLAPTIGGTLAVLSVPVSLAPFLLASRMHSRANLHEYENELVWRRYSTPQLFVAGVNLLGVVTTFVVRLTSDTVA